MALTTKEAAYMRTLQAQRGPYYVDDAIVAGSAVVNFEPIVRHYLGAIKWWQLDRIPDGSFVVVHHDTKDERRLNVIVSAQELKDGGYGEAMKARLLGIRAEMGILPIEPHEAGKAASFFDNSLAAASRNDITEQSLQVALQHVSLYTKQFEERLAKSLPPDQARMTGAGVMKGVFVLCEKESDERRAIQ